MEVESSCRAIMRANVDQRDHEPGERAHLILHAARWTNATCTSSSHRCSPTRSDTLDRVTRRLALVMAVLGCGPVVADTGAMESGTSVDTSGPTTSSSTTTASTTTATTSGDSGPSTIADEASTADRPQRSDLGPLYHCDVWEQNCPDGQKCVAFGWDTESIWDATRCWPVADDPGQLGDPCTVEESSFSGSDDCDFGLMCFFVDADTLTGTCVEQCQGPSFDPTCAPPDTTCLVTNDAPLAVCLPRCDPLDQACGDDAACVYADEDLMCVPVAGDGAAYGDACEYVNSCNAGLLCVVAEFAVDCDASNCCTSFCDLSDADPDLACPGYDQGERCMPVFESLVPGHTDVGFCGIPPE
jgi:hypothetical protein